MADAYGVGVGGRASVDLGRPDRRVGWQVGVEVTRFEGRDRRFGTPYGDGLSVGVTARGRFRLRTGPVAAHGIAGIGAFRESAGDHAPYAVVPDVLLGLGLSIPAGSVHVEPTVGVQAVLSDLLSGSAYAPSIRVPITVAVRF